MGSLVGVRSLAGQVFLLQSAVVVLVVAAALAALVVQAQHDSTADARDRTLAAAESFANSPGILAALASPDPTAVLQPSAEAARKAAGVDAIIVYKLDGITLTHSDPSQIGKRVIGPYAQAAAGQPFTRTFQGSLGLSVVSAVPVEDVHGSVVAIVSCPLTVERVQHRVSRQVPVLFGSAAGALVIAAGGAGLVSRRLRRQTHGLGPIEMTRMYEHHDAVLHAVREGVLIIGGDGRLVLANDEARRLLELPADAEQRHITDLGLEADLAELLTSDRAATDEVYLVADRLLAVSKRLAAPAGSAGSVVTLRDTTELRALYGRAETARERLKLLYDAGGRVGTTLDVQRTARELADVAVPRFADIATVELFDPVLRGEEPPGAGTEIRRTAAAGLQGGGPFYPVGKLIRFSTSHPIAAGVVSGRAVLAANLSTSDGWRAQDPERAERILDHGVHSLLVVPLRARGVVLGTVAFWRANASPRFEEEDVSVAEELAAQAAVCIDNARRYTREHAMAVTLQRSLLPRELPAQTALDVAYRYLPAHAGVGGDWFDVIPLSGSRVALVVGDVVGHGLHAAATMGRLRTAVLNFSALDMPPDELLGRLDELVARIDAEEAAGAGAPGIIGATCQYVVYDPVSGQVVTATAGHPGLAVVHPDGSAGFPQVPINPPLGLAARLPFESAELTVPEGSRLVLYTDGLVEDRDRDLDTGLEALRGALAGPDRTPEATCAAVMEAVLPAQPRDDVALLVARTHRLAPNQVAEWDVPRDPAAVPPVRNACVRQLEEWGLEHIAFAAELTLSELITNAVRYGTEPITVRLLRDRTLICEVSDGSSTSPRMRRAQATDEGGRGLFMVAQLADRWGTRYTPTGKVIWAEHALHNGTALVADDLGLTASGNSGTGPHGQHSTHSNGESPQGSSSAAQRRDATDPSTTRRPPVTTARPCLPGLEPS
ncbi:SpoIIE family protein phosphatase/ATP-binding protein [Streptomyces silvisoli]|uniref:SpoIIE family protein phosphatase n=1 Tax=Streptomyces silvisoli TaxID=3034235 RepID=A0ABT5ZUY7_9ACTN|nr:SpoIIE family protein phosphatase/ATP-binding protein [Streptomyces silvisoli]MDF3293632.1 SpoIIE family protein phosphatase [Streptomyces silvisoli]